jgi:hypothetical protein
MMEIMQILSNFGFPAVVTGYLLVCISGKLDKLGNAVIELTIFLKELTIFLKDNKGE